MLQFMSHAARQSHISHGSFLRQFTSSSDQKVPGVHWFQARSREEIESQPRRRAASNRVTGVPSARKRSPLRRGKSLKSQAEFFR